MRRRLQLDRPWRLRALIRGHDPAPQRPAACRAPESARLEARRDAQTRRVFQRPASDHTARTIAHERYFALTIAQHELTLRVTRHATGTRARFRRLCSRNPGKDALPLSNSAAPARKSARGRASQRHRPHHGAPRARPDLRQPRGPTAIASTRTPRSRARACARSGRRPPRPRLGGCAAQHALE